MKTEITLGTPGPRVAVIGGGAAGSLFALKFARACPRSRIFLIEKNERLGYGLAYGACSEFHVLNVPVRRMEMGIEPSFASWLTGRPREIVEALVESHGEIGDAFVPRHLFGRYFEERVAAALTRANGPGIVHIRGHAVRFREMPARSVVLEDGREIAADIVVLATGNASLRNLPGLDQDSDVYVSNPWEENALHGLDRNAPVLVAGTGLTAIDLILKLVHARHAGPIFAISRHGLLPRTYRIGGRWAPSRPLLSAPPRIFLRKLRAEMERAESLGVSWQRVLDSIRSIVPDIWQSWTLIEKRRFLRHLRAIWDVHRHRLPPRIADKIEQLRMNGQLRVMAGRICSVRTAGHDTEITIRERGRSSTTCFRAARVFNCTGPDVDVVRSGMPLMLHLLWRDLLVQDELGLGIETNRSAALDANGQPSNWLHALGSLTRPELWEIRSIAELNAQIDALVERLAASTGRDVREQALRRRGQPEIRAAF